ncbi:MAG TPA: serine/threonine-protein kinase [Planctomycetaceae bacterium]|nr:serine/threonine-protein kinase [Planctomycetaceae bacterium]
METDDLLNVIIGEYRDELDAADRVDPDWNKEKIRARFLAKNQTVEAALRQYFENEDLAGSILDANIDVFNLPNREKEAAYRSLYAEHPLLADFIDAWISDNELVEQLRSQKSDPTLISASNQSGEQVCSPDATQQFATHPWEGAIVGGFRIEKQIGKGGMGVVFRAVGLVREGGATATLPVAIKFVQPVGAQLTGEEVRAFLAEIDNLAMFQHPHIIAITFVGVYEGTPYFVMPVMRGGTLAEMRQSFQGNFEKIASFVEAVALTIEWAHGKMILHRDLKPKNILFDDSGQFFVCDFGLADNFQKRPSTKSLSENLESASRNASGESVRLSDDRIGSPGWTSPELCPKSGTKSQPDQVGPPSDVYSIGAILYWLLSGEQPPVPNPIGLTASGRPVFAELQSVPN